MNNSESISPIRIMLFCVAGLVCLFLVCGAFVGGCAGIKAFERAQKRANAHNAVAITKIQIQNAQQQAKVTIAKNAIIRAQARQRYLESVGVRQSQDEIAKTLTPLYVQYEMVKALMQIAQSGQNNTVVYIPSGQAGVPVLTAQSGIGK